MLYTYRYVDHNIQKIQDYIDFLFVHVWCEAEGEFDVEKLDGCLELKDLVIGIYIDPIITTDYLYGPIRDIYNIFSTLSKKLRKKLRRWYLVNNSIEQLCANSPCYAPIKYSQLTRRHEALSTKLEDFFKNLYNPNFLSLKIVRETIGDIREHYNSFMDENKQGVCPFCGLHDLKDSNQSKRDAYDHYLPKNVYPFNSINFKNLAPICQECNESYKRVNDPLHDRQNNRRKAFYPYMSTNPDIKIRLDLQSYDMENLTPNDIILQVTSPDYVEETTTWQALFGIDERYKSKCCREAIYWYGQAMDEAISFGVSSTQYLSAKRVSAEQNPFKDNHFLRLPFLEACKRNNLFDPV